MKPLPTKAQIRAELDRQMEAYLNQGGTVNEVPRGTSGIVDNRNTFAHSGESGPKQERTPLDDVVKTIEARKHPQQAAKRKRPRKKLITDDFGEPLRWVWVEE